MSSSADSDGAFEGRTVAAIEGRFLVRDYQRGYRWGHSEVRHLLDDIKNSATSTAYYLQPVVVKPLGDNRWELIDGQQRLTTLYLILQFIRTSNLLPRAQARYTIEYETRPRSADYLQAPDPTGAAENIDFFHMHQAWECIRDWFDEQGNDLQAAIDLHTALSDRVKVIWYEAPDGTETTELFRRLNVGRIPLTDAELVKALVLSRSRDQHGRTDRAASVAAEWDTIERDLRTEELWAFLTGRAEHQATHIGLLLDTLAGSPAAPHRHPFQTFEALRPRITHDPEAFWNSVVDLHSRVLGWYEDRELFHKIGYLVATGSDLAQVLSLADGVGRSEFARRLDDRIQRSLGLTQTQLRELSYEKSRDRTKIAHALLLMNVETVRKAAGSVERYSFQSHASGKWSLEHIHAQNAEELRTVEQWQSWLEQHRDALASLPGLEPSRRNDLEERVDAALPNIDEATFHTLEQELATVFAPDGSGTSEGDEHTIANLTLLALEDNIVLSNSVFEVKRLEVLKRDRERRYIPACTRNVFLKYYTPERAQQVHYWSTQDRRAYLEAVARELEPYLTPEDTNGKEPLS